MVFWMRAAPCAMTVINELTSGSHVTVIPHRSAGTAPPYKPPRTGATSFSASVLAGGEGTPPLPRGQQSGSGPGPGVAPAGAGKPGHRPGPGFSPCRAKHGHGAAGSRCRAGSGGPALPRRGVACWGETRSWRGGVAVPGRGVSSARRVPHLAAVLGGDASSCGDTPARPRSGCDEEGSVTGPAPLEGGGVGTRRSVPAGRARNPRAQPRSLERAEPRRHSGGAPPHTEPPPSTSSRAPAKPPRTKTTPTSKSSPAGA